METLRTRSQELFLRQLSQASRQLQPGGPRLLTLADVQRPNVDVAAQRALLAMTQSPALRTAAAGLAQAVQGGQLGGIYRQDQLVPAQRARQLGLNWWQMIPAAQDAILLLHPQQPLAAPPVVVVRNQVADALERLTRSLAQAWEGFRLWREGRLQQCRQTGGTPVPFFVPLVCLPPGRPTLSLLAYAAGYFNPHPNEAAEVAALGAGTWEPSNQDFSAIASGSSAPLTVATDSLSTLLNVLNGQPSGSIRGLGLVGHSNPSFLSFSGSLGTRMVRGRPQSVVTFDRGRAISKDNLESQPVQDFIQRNTLWDRFAPGGEIILYGCRSGSRASTPDIPAELLVTLSRAFRVCARGFRHKICTFLGHRGNRITQRGLVRYDPQGRPCANLARPPFQTLAELIPDGPSACQGLGTTEARPAREALLEMGW